MAAQNEPKTHYVHITCNNGVFKYTLDDFEVERKDSIEWTCVGSKDDIFGVILATRTPFRWKTKNRKRTQKIKDKIKDAAGYGSYKYFVVVTEGENIWFDDPNFIVRRH